jgi:dihydrofolate reductase
MWNLMTLDGRFEGAKKWDLDWHESVWGEELEKFSIEQLDSADGLVFGRVTYEGMAAYWPTASGESAEVADRMNRIPKFVFSRTLERADWSNTTLVKTDAAAAMPEIKKRGEKDLFVFGSANLSASLMNANLFDEYRLCVVPAVLGVGTPLFPAGVDRLRFKLLDSRPLKSGGVLLRYDGAQ